MRARARDARSAREDHRHSMPCLTLGGAFVSSVSSSTRRQMRRQLVLRFLGAKYLSVSRLVCCCLGRAFHGMTIWRGIGSGRGECLFVRGGCRHHHRLSASSLWFFMILHWWLHEFLWARRLVLETSTGVAGGIISQHTVARSRGQGCHGGETSAQSLDADAMEH